jgi:signal transduction histidine kinase
MEEIGGQFQVRSTVAQGTTISLRLPLPATEAGAGASQPRATQLGDAGGSQSA